MTSITLDRVSDRRRPRSRRFWPGHSGLLVIAGLVTMLVSPAGDDTGERPAGSSRSLPKEGWIVGTTIFVAAAVALLTSFVAGILGALRHAASSTESASLVFGGGH